jgi:hypothetical protein
VVDADLIVVSTDNQHKSPTAPDYCASCDLHFAAVHPGVSASRHSSAVPRSVSETSMTNNNHTTIDVPAEAFGPD